MAVCSDNVATANIKLVLKKTGIEILKARRGQRKFAQ